MDDEQQGASDLERVTDRELGDEALLHELEEAEREHPGFLAEALMEFSGPLPPPGMLKQYDVVVPGAAKDIHDGALQRARHVMDLERLWVEGTLADRRTAREQFRRSQWLAFGLAALLICFGGAAILAGHDWAGATIITGTVVSMILALVWGKRSRLPRGSPAEEEPSGQPPQPRPSGGDLST
jgi:uncharacterized membrane protein